MKDDLEAIERILTLEAVSAGLTWATDLEEIRKNSVELEEMQAFRRPQDGGPEVNGMYRGCEEFCAIYAEGDVGGLPFLWAVVDYIAREADQAVRGDISNASGFAYRYGKDGTALLIATLRSSARCVSRQWRRAETEDEDGQKIAAAVGTDDERFEEAPFVRCEPGDEHATLITVMDLDEDLFSELDELVQAKDVAARRAYREPPEKAAA